MATATAERTGKRLIESDRVEGTTVYDPQGNNIGSSNPQRHFNIIRFHTIQSQ